MSNTTNKGQRNRGSHKLEGLTQDGQKRKNSNRKRTGGIIKKARALNTHCNTELAVIVKDEFGKITSLVTSNHMIDEAISQLQSLKNKLITEAGEKIEKSTNDKSNQLCNDKTHQDPKPTQINLSPENEKTLDITRFNVLQRNIQSVPQVEISQRNNRESDSFQDCSSYFMQHHSATDQPQETNLTGSSSQMKRSNPIDVEKVKTNHVKEAKLYENCKGGSKYIERSFQNTLTNDDINQNTPPFNLNSNLNQNNIESKLDDNAAHLHNSDTNVSKTYFADDVQNPAISTQSLIFNANFTQDVGNGVTFNTSCLDPNLSTNQNNFEQVSDLSYDKDYKPSSDSSEIIYINVAWQNTPFN
ncbi:hypothetical protein DFJ63DRAFT_315454 [Scheffersomyces coipomensis]|uniref:uncharacterized protein n=1 Tax=Scheffersomyces coipomensis TaxID=1788519 RepID=UPI00315C51AA